RFGMWVSGYTREAGDAIGYITREQAVGLPVYDYWLFDSRTLLKLRFTDDDQVLGAAAIEGSAELVQHTYWRDAAQHHGGERAEWQRVLEAGMKSHRLTLSQLDERTKLYRGFENTVIPGLIQTPEYARARFAQVVMVHRVPNDINEAVKARMQRQEMLYRPDKRFHFVITEAALRYRLVGRDIMIGQL